MQTNIQLFFEACQPFGYPLLVCSVLLLAAALYHLFFAARGWPQTLRLLQENPQHPALSRRTDDLAELARQTITDGDTAATEARLRRLIDSARAGLSVIHMITNIAPMLGILGTAWGLVDIFGVFGTPAAQEGIAMGISKALYTTIFGLAIAVPGMIAQTYCERRLERRAALINEVFTELLSRR